ncbi:MAG TPA: phage tail sheath family protein [Syntrophomonadaceae bacterium]|nr:phage tail sheath family protein [Syntrophomonadaceae bacterium]
MAYKHGVYTTEQPSSVIPPANVSAGLPVVFGTAPVNRAADGEGNVNVPVLCYTYQEAVAALGYSDDWESYTLCEFMKSHFSLYNMGPVVLVNVLDPATHKTDVPAADANIIDGVITIAEKDVILSTLVVKLNAEAEQPLVKDTDYTAAFDAEGQVVITPTPDGAASSATKLNIAYSKLNPSAVTAADIVGGVDDTTGKPEGLELINEIFPRFRLVPGMILAPGWSQDPAVAAVMVAKASNINQHFKAIALTDVPITEDKYTDVPEWKTNNNYGDELQVVCWPKVKLGSETYHLSTQLAGLICKTDSENDDIPYMSPSNKSLQMDAAVAADGAEVWLGPDQAAYLNGEGIITALNFVGGWKAWGNRTGCYPGVTDPKDAFLPIRRMINWISNTLVLTFWQKVDYPINRRLIDTVLDSANIWLNGLTARGYLLGGRVEFQQTENPTTDLMDGIVRFHVYVTPPSPARDIDFIIEYDPQYLAGLF